MTPSRFHSFAREALASCGIVRQRTQVLKFKVNGVCVNHCAFCLFHDDPHLLEVADLERFLKMLSRPRFHSIVINGGEPTLHPRFLEICHFLRQGFKGRVHLSLGTNLIPISRNHGKYPHIYRAALETYDRLEVGCDDEHGNVHLLERMAPEIVGAGVSLVVNVVEPYCSRETRRRIMALRDAVDMTVTFSPVEHHYKARTPVRAVSLPCRYRTRDLLLNCNGDAYFCFHQEFEKPLFNLFTVGQDELDFYLSHYDPEPYHFCSCCTRYRPEPLLTRMLGHLDIPRF